MISSLIPMTSISSTLLVDNPPLGEIRELVEACAKQAADALVLTGGASRADVSRAMEAVRTTRVQGGHLDLVEAIARIQCHDEQSIGTVIESLGIRLASTLNPTPQLIPFAGRLIAPSAFYESYVHIHRLAKNLLSPVIFVEENCSIGVGSINPIAATVLAARIQDSVMRRFDIRPFLTIARIDYDSWTNLTHRHFEL